MFNMALESIPLGRQVLILAGAVLVADNLKKVLDCVCSQDALDRLEQKLAGQPIVPITEQDLKDKT
jgi:hypothetical protein